MAGSIEERGKDCWRLVVSGGRDANGARIKHRRVFHGGKREAEKALAAFIVEIERGEYIKPQNMYVRDYLKQWLKDYTLPNTAAQTYERYEQLLRKYAYNTVGKYPLNQVKAPHFQRLYNDLQSNKYGLSGTTILQLHRILAKAFKTACEWQLLSKNPMEYVKAPHKSDKEINVITEEQAGIMLEKAQEEGPLWFYALVALATVGGLRRGELLSLRWQDVDFNKNTISVTQNLQRIKGKGVSFKAPKTKKSRRTIALPGDMMELLKQQKVEQNRQRLIAGTLWQDNDLVLAGTFGKPLCPDYISHLFKVFIERNNLPPVTLHGLRHSAASILIAKGVHAKGISSRLGHSGIQITMNTYGKFFESADREAANKMSGMLPKVKTAIRD
ncbi:MAG: Transposase [Pelotomaculum sp. PtaU1.Bin035]|nr:MAG: Transposase [Pelotomaculum sp. PtaU1.Bin035]